MLTLEQVKNEISKAKTKYSLKRVDVFGSYADGSATNESDLDLLVEFESDAVSLITLNNLKYDLEEAFGISVDVVHSPVANESILQIRNTVRII